MQIGARELATLQAGELIAGCYEIVACVGMGQRGAVYLCRPRASSDPIALKVLKFGEHGEDLEQHYLARFRHEIAATRRVKHPNVVSTYDYISEPLLEAYTMEYVSGGDLTRYLSLTPQMPWVQVVSLIQQMCDGVAAIHAQGIIHRDLKPANILLTESRQIKIADFGIARTEGATRLTARGGIVGTIEYLSPQYLEDGSSDRLGDIYALGTVAYEVITGHTPFRGESVFHVIEQKISRDPVSPRELNSRCPRVLNDVIMQALARDPKQRFQSVIEMRDSLERVGTPRGKTSTRLRVAPRAKGFARRKHTGLALAASILIGMGISVLLLQSPTIDGAETATKNLAQGSSGQLSLALNYPGAENAPELALAPLDDRAQLGKSDLGLLSLQAARSEKSPRSLIGNGEAAVAMIAIEKPVQRTAVRPDAARAAEPVAALAPIEQKASQQNIAGDAAQPAQPQLQNTIVTPSDEYKVRATLLFRFADYVTWPAAQKSASTRICIVGENPFGDFLDQLAKKRSGRAVKIERGASANCSIVYVAASNRAAAEQAFATAGSALTVGERSGSAMIDFSLRDGKVKFEIDRTRVQSAGLELAPILYDLAIRVKG